MTQQQERMENINYEGGENDAEVCLVWAAADYASCVEFFHSCYEEH